MDPFEIALDINNFWLCWMGVAPSTTAGTLDRNKAET